MLQNIQNTTHCKASESVDADQVSPSKALATRENPSMQGHAVLNDETETLAMSSLYDENDVGIEDTFSEDDTLSSSSSYRSLEELDDDLEPGNYCYDGQKSVTWSPMIVTQTNYRLRTSTEDKELLHYTGADMTRFRQLYKMQIKAAKKMMLEQQKTKEEEQRQQDEKNAYEYNASSYQNPISGFINMFISKVYDLSDSSTSSLRDNSISRRSLETTILIDTLYLF